MGIANHPSGPRVRAERNILRQTPRQVLRYLPNGKINPSEGIRWIHKHSDIWRIIGSFQEQQA